MARILIADDEPHSRRLLQFRIEKAGHDVVLAADGSEALEKVRAEPFDLLVTDFCMPKLDGRELCEAIREQEQDDARLLIVMVTSKVESELRTWSGDVQSLFFMEKPVSPRALIELIDELLASRARVKPGDAA